MKDIEGIEIKRDKYFLDVLNEKRKDIDNILKVAQFSIPLFWGKTPQSVRSHNQVYYCR